MYAPPIDIQTEIFARLPERFRRVGKSSAWLDAHRRGEALHSFLEGPSFDRAGFLYVVDIAFGRVFRVSPAGEFELVAEYPGEPNGLKIHRDGRVFITDFRHGVMLLDVEHGRVEPFLTEYAGRPFQGVNDLFFTANGDLYFTDQGHSGQHERSGALFRYSAAGQLERLLDAVPSPNGLVSDLIEGSILLAVTRDNAVWRVPMQLNGQPHKVGVFIQLSGGVGPDGLALDEAGGLAVAHFGLGSVWLFSSSGEPLYRLRAGTGLGTTNVAYGWPDRRRLYIVESLSGCIVCAKMPVAGRLMYSHAALPE